MRRIFIAVSLAVLSALFIACGGGSHRPPRFDADEVPANNSVVYVNGIYLDGFAVVADDYDDLASFVNNIKTAPDICRNLVRSGKVKQLKNLVRVRIEMMDRFDGTSLVKVLDGEYAGTLGHMMAIECGAEKKKTKPAAGDASSKSMSKK